MHTEEYQVVRNSASFSPPGPNPPTTQITVNVQATNSPPTPVPQVKVIRSSSQSGTGSEIEQVTPPRTLYARVNLSPTRFDQLKTKLQDPACTVHFIYQSQVVSGNDPINSFDPIYVY